MPSSRPSTVRGNMGKTRAMVSQVWVQYSPPWGRWLGLSQMAFCYRLRNSRSQSKPDWGPSPLLFRP